MNDGDVGGIDPLLNLSENLPVFVGGLAVGVIHFGSLSPKFIPISVTRFQQDDLFPVSSPHDIVKMSSQRALS